MSPRKLSRAESREIERQIRAEIEAGSRPETMLQIITFDVTPDHRVRVVRMRAADEADDVW